MDIYELMKYAIVIVAGIMAYAEFAQAIERKAWVKWGLGFIGVYWAVYYAFSILRSLYGWQIYEHQVFVRSGILLTLALVGGNALMTLDVLRRIRK
jgi:membrane protein YdbS with pleckstrin-like domain